MHFRNVVINSIGPQKIPWAFVERGSLGPRGWDDPSINGCSTVGISRRLHHIRVFPHKIHILIIKKTHTYIYRHNPVDQHGPWNLVRLSRWFTPIENSSCFSSSIWHFFSPSCIHLRYHEVVNNFTTNKIHPVKRKKNAGWFPAPLKVECLVDMYRILRGFHLSGVREKIDAFFRGRSHLEIDDD